MPYVKVELTDGATKAQKIELYKGITDVLVRVLGKNPEYTFIVIDEVSTDNWGHKGTSVTELRKGDPKMRPKGPPKAAAKAPRVIAAKAPAPKSTAAKSAKPAAAKKPVARKPAAKLPAPKPAKAPAKPASTSKPRAPVKKGPSKKA